MLEKIFFLLVILPFVSCDCPNGAVEYQSNCYYFRATKTNFIDAEISCEKLGGYLISIHDSFTNSFIKQKAQNYFYDSTVTDFWMGANNFDSNEKWNWSDGSDFDYNDWQKGEPQNTSDSLSAA